MVLTSLVSRRRRRWIGSPGRSSWRDMPQGEKSMVCCWCVNGLLMSFNCVFPMFWFLLIVFEWELDVFDADPSKWDVFHFPYGFSGFSMDFPWIFPWWTVRHGFFVRSTRTTATTGHGPLTPSPTPRSEPSPNMASVLACITASKFRWGRCRKRAIYIYISPDMVIGKMMVKIVKIVGYPIFRQIHEVMCFFF